MDAALHEAFADPEAALVHVRAVEHGCFLYEARRARPPGTGRSIGQTYRANVSGKCADRGEWHVKDGAPGPYQVDLL